MQRDCVGKVRRSVNGCGRMDAMEDSHFLSISAGSFGRKSHVIAHWKYRRRVPFIATQPHIIFNDCPNQRKNETAQDEKCRIFFWFFNLFSSKVSSMLFRYCAVVVLCFDGTGEATSSQWRQCGAKKSDAKFGETWFRPTRIRWVVTSTKTPMVRHASSAGVTCEVLMLLIFISGLSLDDILKWLLQLSDAANNSYVEIRISNEMDARSYTALRQFEMWMNQVKSGRCSSLQRLPRKPKFGLWFINRHFHGCCHRRMCVWNCASCFMRDKERAYPIIGKSKWQYMRLRVKRNQYRRRSRRQKCKWICDLSTIAHRHTRIRHCWPAAVVWWTQTLFA